MFRRTRLPISCSQEKKGRVWQIDEAPDDYTPQSADEQAVLEMIRPEPNPFDELPDSTDEAQAVEEVPVSKSSVVS
jgi:hypothetical protein